MQYHCLSLLEHPFVRNVHLMGYEGTPLISPLEQNKRLCFHKVAQFPYNTPSGVLGLIFMPMKAMWLFASLLFSFQKLSRSNIHYILLQNPPAIPTLLLSHCICFTFGIRLIIDWHNFAFSIVSLQYSRTHPFVIFSWMYEYIFGRGAYASFCVSKTMQKELKSWGIDSTVLYDKPPSFFKQCSSDDTQALFRHLEESESSMNGVKIWLQQSKADILPMRQWADDANHRPVLLVTSTSYTKDEDLSVLLKALEQCDRSLEHPVLLFVTGKGPMYNFYQQEISKLHETLTNVYIVQIWLRADDYPVLLGSCDLGISLHASSSGFDLPMKIVDMFGCGLPVCALGFEALSELLKDGENGLIFENSTQLSHQLTDLIGNRPAQRTKLEKLRMGVLASEPFSHRWKENWNQHALPLFTYQKSSFTIQRLFIPLSLLLLSISVIFSCFF